MEKGAIVIVDTFIYSLLWTVDGLCLSDERGGDR
jgi:hypothetical protein